MEFKYDLAISLLDEDAQLGYDIIAELGNPDKIFFYKKNDTDLVFKNGLNVFGNVFAEQARFILILYRKKYGTTDWTALENSIIQDRFLKTIKFGNCPILFWKLDDSPTPNWLNSNYIYSSHNFEDLIKLVRKQITDAGGVSYPQTNEEKLKLFTQKQRYEVEFKEKELRDIELVKIAKEEAIQLKENILTVIEKNAIQNRLYFDDLTPKISNNIVLKLKIENVIVYLDYSIQYSNSICDSKIFINISSYKEHNYDKPTRIKNYELKKSFYISFDNEKGWRDVNNKNFLTTKRLGDIIFDKVVEYLVTNKI